jgi:hypothetical protein
LAGVDDPAALVELKLLVDRARIGTTVMSIGAASWRSW